MEDCEFNKLADYEDDSMTSLERMTFSQLQTYCFQTDWVNRDEVVGHRSCDKTFTLYRSNLSAFRRPAEDAIEGTIGEGPYSSCDRCEEWYRYVSYFLMLFRVGVSCRILYSIVSYLYVSCSGSITSVASLSAIVYL